MANWWEELQKNNSQQSMSLAEYGKTFNKADASLSPTPTPLTAPDGKQYYRHYGTTKSDTGVGELFETPLRFLSESITAAGIVSQAMLREPTKYIGNYKKYAQLYKSAYLGAQGDRANKQWWQGGEDPVTLGQMYDALFNPDAPDLLDSDAVNRYYENQDFFDENGIPTARFRSGGIDLLALIFLDPLNAIGGGSTKVVKGLEALEDVSKVASTAAKVSAKESIETTLRVTQQAPKASETVLGSYLRESNPLRRQAIETQLQRIAEQTSFHDRAGLLDDSGDLLKYGSDEYQSASRIMYELFAPIEDTIFPDPAIRGITDLIEDRPFRYFVLDGNSFATDGSAIFRWDYPKNRWLPNLTFPKIDLVRTVEKKQSFSERLADQIVSYNVGSEKVFVSPHVEEMLKSNLTDGPFGAGPGNRFDPNETPSSVFNIPAVNAEGTKVAQPLSVGSKFSRVKIDGRNVYVLYDSQYKTWYTLQSLRTPKKVKPLDARVAERLDAGKENFVDSTTVDATPVYDDVDYEDFNTIIDESTQGYDTGMLAGEDELTDFGKDNLFTVEDAPRGTSVTGQEAKERLSSYSKLYWVKADWFDLARVESYEYKFIDGVTGRSRTVQVPADFKLVNRTDAAKGGRPIFVRYVKTPGEYKPEPVQYTIGRSNELVPMSKAIADDVAYKDAVALAAKNQAALQADIAERMNDPKYIAEMRQMHSSEYLGVEPRTPTDYQVWYEYKPNGDDTVTVTAMARRVERDGFDDFSEVVSSKETILHTWENVPEKVIENFTYKGRELYFNRGGHISPKDERVDIDGTTLWDRTIGNSENPAVSLNVDDIYRFGYSRPMDPPTIKAKEVGKYVKVDEDKYGEDILEWEVTRSQNENRFNKFNVEREELITKRNRAFKEFSFIEKKYPNWEETLQRVTALRTRWNEINSELKSIQDRLANVGFENKAGLAKNEALRKRAAVLEKELADTEEFIRVADNAPEMGSAEVKYALRAKSLQMYLKHLDTIRPYYYDVNHYILAYAKGLIGRNFDVRKTESWMLNFEDYLNTTLRTDYDIRKGLQGFADDAETFKPSSYLSNVDEPIINSLDDDIASMSESAGRGNNWVVEDGKLIPVNIDTIKSGKVTFYHGSNSDFKVGDTLTGKEVLNGEFARPVNASTSKEWAANYGKVYTVEPLNPKEMLDTTSDPTIFERMEAQRQGGHHFVSMQGFRVTGVADNAGTNVSKVKLNSPDEVPLNAGETPIPDGYIRVYYGSRHPEDIRKIRSSGKVQSGAETQSDPLVFLTTKPDHYSNNSFIEFGIPKESLDSTTVNTFNNDVPEPGVEWFTYKGEIPLDYAVAIHEPWHKLVNDFVDDETRMKWVVEGRFDDEIAEGLNLISNPKSSIEMPFALQEQKINKAKALQYIKDNILKRG